jgi:hypothetical protein
MCALWINKQKWVAWKCYRRTTGQNPCHATSRLYSYIQQTDQLWIQATSVSSISVTCQACTNECIQVANKWQNLSFSLNKTSSNWEYKVSGSIIYRFQAKAFTGMSYQTAWFCNYEFLVWWLRLAIFQAPIFNEITVWIKGNCSTINAYAKLHTQLHTFIAQFASILLVQLHETRRKGFSGASPAATASLQAARGSTERDGKREWEERCAGNVKVWTQFHAGVSGKVRIQCWMKGNSLFQFKYLLYNAFNETVQVMCDVIGSVRAVAEQ